MRGEHYARRMSRPLRIELPNGLYHVTSRGDRREPIFEDDDDRKLLLEVLARGLERFDALVFAYCLMGNHYHFVLQTRQGNLSRLMRHLNGVYSQGYNRRHGLVGHLFQGRFKAIHIDADAYFLQVCRYVELNPVRARITDDPANWYWSSYRSHVGIDRAPSWLDSEALFGYLLGHDVESAEDVGRARAVYEQFVRDGSGDRLWERALRQDIYLGEASFVEQIQKRMSDAQASSKEIPGAHSRAPAATRPNLREPMSREMAMRLALAESGRSLSSIAVEWNLSVSRVSRLIKRAEDKMRSIADKGR